MITRIENVFRKRPLLGVYVSVLLFLVSCLYTRLKLAGTLDAEGHSFVYEGMMSQQIDGKMYFIPIYRTK